MVWGYYEWSILLSSSNNIHFIFHGVGDITAPYIPTISHNLYDLPLKKKTQTILSFEIQQSQLFVVNSRVQELHKIKRNDPCQHSTCGFDVSFPFENGGRGALFLLLYWRVKEQIWSWELPSLSRTTRKKNTRNRGASTTVVFWGLILGSSRLLVVFWWFLRAQIVQNLEDPAINQVFFVYPKCSIGTGNIYLGPISPMLKMWPFFTPFMYKKINPKMEHVGSWCTTHVSKKYTNKKCDTSRGENKKQMYTPWN